MSNDSKVERGVNGRADPLGGRFDIGVPDVRVTQTQGGVVVPQQPGDDRKRDAVEGNLTGEAMAKIVFDGRCRGREAPKARAHVSW